MSNTQFKKGNIVTVKACVFCSTLGRPTLSEQHEHTSGFATMGKKLLTLVHEVKAGFRSRNLWRFEYHEPWTGIVTGYSFRRTGDSWPNDYDAQGYLTVDKSHRVVMVQPLRSERWLRPVTCLEGDLEVTG